MLLASLCVRRGVAIFWSALVHLAALLLDLFTVRRQSESAKDLENVLLRHQLRVLQRQHGRPGLAGWEKLTLAPRLRRLTAAGRE